MSTQAPQNSVPTYYFNPCTQRFSTNYLGEPSVTIQIDKPTNLSATKLFELIQTMGNQYAIVEVERRSLDTKSNYCSDYTKHLGTCDQAYYQRCKRHLTEAEMELCADLKKGFQPHDIVKGLESRSYGFTISRGDTELMRNVLNCVQKAINAAN